MSPLDLLVALLVVAAMASVGLDIDAGSPACARAGVCCRRSSSSTTSACRALAGDDRLRIDRGKVYLDHHAHDK